MAKFTRSVWRWHNTPLIVAWALVLAAVLLGGCTSMLVANATEKCYQGDRDACANAAYWREVRAGIWAYNARVAAASAHAPVVVHTQRFWTPTPTYVHLGNHYDTRTCARHAYMQRCW